MKHHFVFHSRLGHFIEPQFSKSHLVTDQDDRTFGQTVNRLFE